MIKDFKELRFETSSLTMNPVSPKRITALHELPLISYRLTDKELNAKGIDDTYVHFDINDSRTENGYYDNMQVRGLARQVLEAMRVSDVKITDSGFNYTRDPLLFITAGIREALNLKYHLADPKISNDPIVMVPLPQGATLYLVDDDSSRVVSLRHSTTEWRKSVIVQDRAVFFGKKVWWMIYHPHSKEAGFTFDPEWMARHAVKALRDAFPFLKGNVEIEVLDTVIIEV